MLPSQATPDQKTTDMKFVIDEEFDFDIPVSPNDSNKTAELEDEDVVFFGPVKHREKCIAVAVEEAAQENVKPWSPLSAEMQAELFKQSQLVVYHLSNDRKSSSETSSSLSPRKLLKHPRHPHIDELQKQHQAGQMKRKLSDTSFISIPSETDISINLSQLSMQDQTCNSETKSSPGSDSGKLENVGAFVVDSTDSVTSNLREVLPVVQLTPDVNGVVKFGVSQKSGCRGSTGRKSSMIRPPARTSIPRASPPKKMRVIPKPENSNNPVTIARNHLAKSTSSARKSTIGAIPKRALAKPSVVNNSMKPPQPIAATSRQQASNNAPKTSGLKPPGFNNPRVPALGSQNDNHNQPIGINSTSQVNTVIKAPVSKLQLISQQRKTLAATRTKPVKPGETSQGAMKPPGPMKALIPVPKTSNKECVISEDSKIKPPLNTVPVKSGCLIQTTPTKQHKRVQPKNIFGAQHALDVSDTQRVTPEHQNSSSSITGTVPSNSTPIQTQSAKRRSLLPTPKRGSVSSSGYRSSISSVSSIDSMLTGSPSFAQSKSKGPRVQHTPVGGKENDSRLSIWSPIKKAKPIYREDEAIQCTKRSVLSNHN